MLQELKGQQAEFGGDSLDNAGAPVVPADNAPLVLEVSGASVTVPGGHFLLVAEYVREGADLVLVGPDGQTVVVRDYFSSDAPPTLITEGGSRISPDLAEALAGPVAPAQSAQAGQAAATPPIGQVQTLEGTATAMRADGTEVTLTSGSPIFQGDVIETGCFPLGRFILALWLLSSRLSRA